jgi:hypothetical protein
MGATTDETDEAAYAEYVARFGPDNAAYLMEMAGAWRSHYDRAAFIDSGVGDASGVEERVRREAQRRGWLFERMVGDLGLVRRLIDGDWAEDFLVLQAGQRLAMSYDPSIVRAEVVVSAPPRESAGG